MHVDAAGDTTDARGQAEDLPDAGKSPKPLYLDADVLAPGHPRSAYSVERLTCTHEFCTNLIWLSVLKFL